MKSRILIPVAVIMFWACSTPRYSYHFDTYDYNSGRKQSSGSTSGDQASETSPVLMDNPVLEARADAIADPSIRPASGKTESSVTPAITRTERKEIKKDLKNLVKEYSKLKKKSDHVGTSQASKQMDHDLKMAAIFGAVGLLLSLLGGVHTLFWVLGVVALVIGVVFLIKWIARQ